MIPVQQELLAQNKPVLPDRHKMHQTYCVKSLEVGTYFAECGILEHEGF